MNKSPPMDFSMPIDELDALQRFLQKVVFDKSGCWLWTGARWHRMQGYGTFWYGGNIRAHRFAYEFFKRNQVPKGHQIRHTCHNTMCVNPKHLLTGTPWENTQDKMKAKRHQVHSRLACRNGHDWTNPENVQERNYKHKYRTCKVCERLKYLRQTEGKVIKRAPISNGPSLIALKEFYGNDYEPGK